MRGLGLERFLQDLPGGHDAFQQITKSGLREVLAELREVGVDALGRLGLQRQVARGLHAREPQQPVFDEALRQHAQLPGAVHAFGEVCRLDDVLRHLAEALVAVHRSGAQDLEGGVVADLARAHQDAFGALHGLAFFEARGDVLQFVEQDLLALEAGLRQLNQRAQALRAVAVDHPDVYARCHRALDAGGVAVVREHDHRARRHAGQRLGGLKQRVAGLRHLANHQVWCMAHHALHQFAARIQHGEHLDPAGFQVVHQRLRTRRTFEKNQRRSHMNQGLG